MSHPASSATGRRARLAILPLWLVLAAGASAAVYKWTDPQGGTHYSDLPPMGGAKPIDVKPASLPPSATPASAGTPAAADGADAGGEAAGASQKNPERVEYCRRAQDDLKRYEGADQLVRENDEGKQVVLDDKERAALMERARKDVQKWCK
ncbi:DUF4124 domain-containing protein [Endothiovibrio diazotrophicus]